MATKKKTTMSFDTAVSRFRRAIMNLAKKNKEMSTIDLVKNIPSVSGSRRGAIVRRAFESLIEDKKIRRTTRTVYNANTRNRVSVYTKR
jgi:uncharacterized FlgJ-related protein